MVKRKEEEAYALENEYVRRLKRYSSILERLNKEWLRRHEELQNYMKKEEENAQKELENNLKWMEGEFERLRKRLEGGQLSKEKIAEIEKDYVSRAIANYKLLRKLGAFSEEDKERMRELKNRYEELNGKGIQEPLPWRKMWREYFSSQYRLRIARKLEDYFRKNMLPLEKESVRLFNEWLKFCEHYHRKWKKLQEEHEKALKELEKLEKNYQDRINTLTERRDSSARKAHEEYLKCLERASFFD